MSNRILIPGKKRFYIPAVLDKGLLLESATISRTPEWMVCIGENGKELTKSSVKDFEEYIELMGWYHDSSRQISGSVSAPLFTSSAVKNSDLIIMIPPGEHGPKLEHWMYQGKNIPLITIVRLGWSEEKNQILQKIKFSVNRIIMYQQNIQYYVIYIQTNAVNNDIYVFSQETGQSTGHKISDINFRKNALKFESK